MSRGLVGLQKRQVLPGFDRHWTQTQRGSVQDGGAGQEDVRDRAGEQAGKAGLAGGAEADYAADSGDWGPGGH